MAHSTSYGESAHTAEKLRIFGHLIRMHVGICDGKRWCRDYRYIDMNAGPGVAPKCQVDGSPLQFLAAAKAARQLPYRAFLIEQDPASAAELAARVAPFGRAEVVCGDHAALLPPYIARLNKAPVGLVYHDPNGQPSFQTLAQVFASPLLARVDLMIYFGASWINRWNGWYHNRDRPYHTLTDSLATIDKQYWIIRTPLDSAHWTYCIGTNWSDFPKWKKQGFYDVTSPEGKAILEKLTFRAKVRAEQHALPFEEGDDDDSLTDR